MKTILLVEDDLHVADGLIINLEADGFQVVHVDHGNQVLSEFERGNFDLILMDIMLPGMDGLALCKKIRDMGSTIPILFITARDETEQKIEGLLCGGDDYITKPFDVNELLARIQGIFRRQAWLSSSEKAEDSFEFDNRSVNFKTYEAKGPGGNFELTRRECMVLKYLIEREGEVVSRDQLLDAIWGYRIFPTNRTIDNFILKLRKIFENNPKNPQYIETIRGVGYRFKIPKNEK
ncbi:MAG: response regulator transcription factor [FCB group bacterium]|nr:response regulator transcription factor [FCB group bacterium]